jgi:hypothetical protein
MNERIRELADQILPNEKEFHQGDPTEWGYFFTGEELEKFAELIVRECEKVIRAEIAVTDIDGEAERAWEMGMECGVGLIKEHFGVEK